MARLAEAERVRRFRARVWRHFRRHARTMPWRETRDPYRILVSEIMLQQTQVGRVRPKYAQFLAAFPGFAALDRAPLARVLAVWSGLGYNRRALSLKRIARELALRHGGRLPEEPEALAALPGIGPATAGAVSAFAFGRPAVFIETNIRRVFLQEFFPRRRRVADGELLPLVARTLDRARPREWYYALMDYGAALRGRVPNPNRRSRGYTRQPPFEGSDRQARAQILRLLLADGAAGSPRLARITGGDEARALRLAGDLAREGLLERRGRRFAIAGGGGGGGRR